MPTQHSKYHFGWKKLCSSKPLSLNYVQSGVNVQFTLMFPCCSQTGRPISTWTVLMTGPPQLCVVIAYWIVWLVMVCLTESFWCSDDLDIHSELRTPAHSSSCLCPAFMSIFMFLLSLTKLETYGPLTSPLFYLRIYYRSWLSFSALRDISLMVCQSIGQEFLLQDLRPLAEIPSRKEMPTPYLCGREVSQQWN